ncbi:Signal transduction histidine kinase [Flavobacterium defluvii]|uniref:histidine kinase n=2 Tax=Flavobacterium defluvii TaxID=370979 RepID=A0A1M5SVZ2_9FLAO|nr:Signal transduction histidine kinase [Flavobacterium defluvii]
MLRSPIFILFILLFFLSCEEKSTTIYKVNPIKNYASSLQKEAISYFQKNKYDSSFYYFNKSKVAFEKFKDSGNIAFNLVQMAQIQQINGDYYGSKETLTEALPYVKNDINYSAAINNFFGIADKELSIYDDAIFYYKQAIKDVSDSISRQSPLNNIAVVYMKQNKYDKAIEILESILNKNIFDNKTSSLKSKYRVMDNLGFTYFKKGLNEKGLQLMTESLKLRKQIDDSYGSIESYFHLSEYYAKTDIKKSNEYAKNAYEIATKFNSVDERLRALSFLISNDAGIQYGQKYISINDSIIKVRNNYKNKFAKIKYDSKKEKDENQKLRLERAENELSLQRARFQNIFYIIGIISLFFLLAYLRKHYKNKTKLVEIKTAYETETRIAKDIHDGLANDVFNTITFTQTQPLEFQNTKETLVQKLDHIYSRVRGISRENNDIDTGPNYFNNLKEMLSAYSSNEINVSINRIEKVNWDSVEDLKKIAIQRVLHELMVNMKKHSNASVVVLKFESNSNALFINYSDNGKGCDKSKIIKNGLQNMENRILAIKGTITFETEPDKGFKAKITMPK